MEFEREFLKNFGISSKNCKRTAGDCRELEREFWKELRGIFKELRGVFRELQENFWKNSSENSRVLIV